VLAITGASGGIGRSIALACAQHQGQLILIGRNAAKLETVHAEILATGAPEPAIAVLDLERALAGDFDQVADAVLERYGRLDGLLHNAALLGTLTPIEHYDVPTWCRVMHVNVTAAFALTQVLLPALKRSADASVVFTASSVGRKGRAFHLQTDQVAALLDFRTVSVDESANFPLGPNAYPRAENFGMTLKLRRPSADLVRPPFRIEMKVFGQT